MSEKRKHISDHKWDQVLKSMDRREFIMASTAAGVLTMVPRFASAAAETYKLGLLLPVTAALPTETAPLTPLSCRAATESDAELPTVVEVEALLLY